MVNLDRAGSQLDSLAVARQIVGALALDLDRGVSWRDLFDQPGEARQQLADNGSETIRRRHTCAHRAQQLIEICDELEASPVVRSVPSSATEATGSLA